jgi:LuxR family maltose regulon positive regulatory protein
VAKPKVIKRERVNRALESIFEFPMTILEAPVGYGKTTAVREFLVSKGVFFLWVSLLSEDDTPASFWDRLSSELGKIDETAAHRVKSLGFPSDTPQTAVLINVLRELEYEPDTTLVIDDFHLAKTMRITALFRRFVTEMPEDFHIVFITRDTSNLDIAELAAKGRCNLLPQNMLKFTDKEVREYCALMGFSPSERELKKLCEYTGGWISLIYLVMLGVSRGMPLGYNSAIDSLIESVLYSVYDERIKTFLLRCSIMNSFTAEQAMFVTQQIKSEEFLKKLRRENAFVAFDETTGEYTIHDVLLDFLRAKQKNETEREALYRLLGEWHLKNKSYKMAYENFNRAHDTQRILEILDSPDNVTNAFAEFEGSLQMFAETPRALLCQYPIAYLQYIGLLLSSGDAEAAKDGVTRLDELKSVYLSAKDVLEEKKNRVLAEISGIRIFAVFNDVGKIFACINEASRLIGGGSSVLFKKENEFTFGSPHFLYIYYREAGRFKETSDFIADRFPDMEHFLNGLGAGCNYLALAEYSLETLDEKTAELNAFKAIYKAKTKEQTGIAICANFALIRLFIYQGRVAEAREHLKQLERDVQKEGNAIYYTTVEMVKAYVAACLGRPDGVPAWLLSGDMSPARFMYQGIAFNYIVHSKAVLLSKDYLRLEILTEEFEKYFSAFSNRLGFIHNRILRAVAKYRLYSVAAGSAELSRALSDAREDNIIMPFAEYAVNILDMMRQIGRENTSDSYIQRVLEACGRYAESIKSAPQSSADLSAREIEILSFTAEGLKRDEIAAKLVISSSTVKTHLQNIYQKLEVSGKTSAIKKAQQMKLL